MGARFRGPASELLRPCIKNLRSGSPPGSTNRREPGVSPREVIGVLTALLFSQLLADPATVLQLPLSSAPHFARYNTAHWSGDPLN